MKQGIQTNFPHEQIKLYGCYFLSILRWAELVDNKTFDENEIIKYYNHFIDKGWMQFNCFMVNPLSALNDIVELRKYRQLFWSPVNKGQPLYFVYLKKPNHGHFTLGNTGSNLGEIILWDSLDPERIGAKDYKIDSYRVVI